MVELSIIIPTYNRADRLRTCLEALAQQTQPVSDYEVIVVVDGSTDETTEMLGELATSFSLIVLSQANSGQHIARNLGAARARGQYLLFLDDDIVAEPQLVAEHLRLHREQDNVVGIGQITLKLAGTDWYTQRFAEGWREHYGQLNQTERPPDWRDGYGGNISVSRAAFAAVGGFASDIRRSHDIEFAYRLSQHGLTFVYLPLAAGRHDESKGARQLFADAARSGAAWVTLCERHPAMLPELLGPLGDTSVREAFLREVFWRCGFSPWLLAQLGSFLARTSWGDKWYRFLFTYSYWCGVREAIPDRDTWQRMVRGVPILMYHAFAAPGEPASRYILPARRFAQQMTWLKRLKYNVLSLEEFLGFRKRCELPPPRSIVITIDDGYTETAALAFPILHRHHFAATIFLVSDRVGGCNDWTGYGALDERQLLSWTQVREMACEGVRFGAHTQTHPLLIDIPVEQAYLEVAGSRVDIERALQMPVLAFAYPYGEFDKPVQALVEQAGFLGACGVDSGFNSWSIPLTALRRLEVGGTWSLVRFLLAVRLGEDVRNLAPSLLRPVHSEKRRSESEG
jgi:glycosyltransferase involved in cell wall biosynthesis/peptidoglycan/xylan/chitin deacetylase (PgdA/CDA1 family)